jgi:hypothetical protein
MMEQTGRLQRVHRFASALLIAGALIGGAATLTGSHAYAEPRPFAPGEPACTGPDGQHYHEGDMIRVGDPDKGPIYVCGRDGNFHPLPTKLVSRGLPNRVVANEVAP